MASSSLNIDFFLASVRLTARPAAGVTKNFIIGQGNGGRWQVGMELAAPLIITTAHGFMSRSSFGGEREGTVGRSSELTPLLGL